MTDTLRPRGGMGTLLRRSIRAEDTELPVLAISSLRVDADPMVGTEYVRCAAFGTDAVGGPTLTGCERGVRLEDGGSAPRDWPGGTDVAQVSWTTTEGLDTLPAVAEEGRSVEVGGIHYFGQDRGDGVIQWVALNDATFDAGTLTIASGAVTLPRVRSNIAIVTLAVDTEGGAATDDLLTITPTGTIDEGTILILRTVSDLRQVNLVNTGNLFMISSPIPIYAPQHRIVFAWSAAVSAWREISRSIPGFQTRRSGVTFLDYTFRLDFGPEFTLALDPAGRFGEVDISLADPVITERAGSSTNATSPGNTSATATCNAGEISIGGGFDTAGAGLVCRRSQRSGTTGWTITMRNDTGGTIAFTPSVICMKSPL